MLALTTNQMRVPRQPQASLTALARARAGAGAGRLTFEALSGALCEQGIGATLHVDGGNPRHVAALAVPQRACGGRGGARGARGQRVPDGRNGAKSASPHELPFGQKKKLRRAMCLSLTGYVCSITSVLGRWSRTHNGAGEGERDVAVVLARRGAVVLFACLQERGRGAPGGVVGRVPEAGGPVRWRPRAPSAP